MAAGECPACGRILLKNHNCKAVYKPSGGAQKAVKTIGKENAQIDAKSPKIKSTFEDHIMKGEASGKTHSGLHSMFQLLELKKQPKAIAVKASDQSKCYLATVTLYEVPKDSSFFPDTMNYKTILGHVTTAWRYYMKHKIECNAVKLKFGTKWAGVTSINEHQVWIGGMEGDGDDTAMATAFPLIAEAQDRLSSDSKDNK
jgi:hypothetical protein